MIIDKELDKLLKKVEKPARYIGGRGRRTGQAEGIRGS